MKILHTFKPARLMAIFLLIFISTNNCFANVDCSIFYKKVDDFTIQMTDLKNSVRPLTSYKQAKLDSLWLKANNAQNYDDRKVASAELYSDPDYEQFDTIRMLGFILKQVEFLNSNGGWYSDKKLLDLAAKGKVEYGANGFSKNPYENIKKYSELSRDISLWINDFTRRSAIWKKNRTGFSESQIELFEIRSNSYFYTFSNISNCNLSYLQNAISAN